MPSESQIPIASQGPAKRFATRLALFYGTLFGLVGTHLPFFPVWLKAIGIDASWIGIITAVPSLTRFTVLPFITGLAEKRQSLRGAMIATAFVSALGFSIIGTLHQPLAVFLAYAVTACLWTPMTPLTDAYALKGVSRYGLNYGPLRLWGSAAFVVGALACGLLVDVIAAKHLIWVIVGVAGLGALVSLGLQPLEVPKAVPATSSGAAALLREPGFLAIIVAAALIQGSHAAYYTFASIAWQNSGLGGLTIAGLWALGVIAEIVVFALSPRFTLSPAMLVIIAALSAVARWTDYGAGAAAAGARGSPAGAWADIRADANRHHGADGAACAGSCDGERARLSHRLHRDRHQHRVCSVRRDLCAARAGRLLPDGRDGDW